MFGCGWCVWVLCTTFVSHKYTHTHRLQVQTTTFRKEEKKKQHTDAKSITKNAHLNNKNKELATSNNKFTAGSTDEKKHTLKSAKVCPFVQKKTTAKNLPILVGWTFFLLLPANFLLVDYRVFFSQYFVGSWMCCVFTIQF